MSVRLIVAAAENDVIGNGGDLPWHLPADLRRFAALTRGRPVVMGRLTHESIVRRLGHPLPGRPSVVLSRRAPASPGEGVTSPGEAGGSRERGVEWAQVPETAAKTAHALAADLGVPDWFVIGGATVYAELLPLVDVVDLTRVHLQGDGDVRMPVGWLDDFVLHTQQAGPDQGDGVEFTYQQLRRRR